MHKLFTAGPTQISDEILHELSRQMISHRGKEYALLHEEIINQLKSLFNWHDYYVFLVTSSATGVMEGVIRNCIADIILHTICGEFSKRWAEISQMNEKQVIKIEIEAGKAVKPYMLEQILLKEKPEAVTITYCETSTGVLNPLEDLARTIRKIAPEILILVDAVSAFGGVPFLMKEWDIDIMFFGVQKTFALPPGLSILVVSERAFQKSLGVKNKGYYFNFEVFAKYNEKNNTPATPVIPIIYGLRKQLERIKKEGLQKRFLRHKAMLDLVKAWAMQNKFKFFSEEGYESPTVSALQAPDGFNIAKLLAQIKHRGFEISPGYGPLKDKTFRIGHMGEHTPDDVKELLNAMSQLISQ